MQIMWYSVTSTICIKTYVQTHAHTHTNVVLNYLHHMSKTHVVKKPSKFYINLKKSHYINYVQNPK